MSRGGPFDFRERGPFATGDVVLVDELGGAGRARGLEAGGVCARRSGGRPGTPCCHRQNPKNESTAQGTHRELLPCIRVEFSALRPYRLPQFWYIRAGGGSTIDKRWRRV